jgi:hypothetical protein
MGTPTVASPPPDTSLVGKQAIIDKLRTHVENRDIPALEKAYAEVERLKTRFPGAIDAWESDDLACVLRMSRNGDWGAARAMIDEVIARGRFLASPLDKNIASIPQEAGVVWRKYVAAQEQWDGPAYYDAISPNAYEMLDRIAEAANRRELADTPNEISGPPAAMAFTLHAFSLLSGKKLQGGRDALCRYGEVLMPFLSESCDPVATARFEPNGANRILVTHLATGGTQTVLLARDSGGQWSVDVTARTLDIKNPAVLFVRGGAVPEAERVLSTFVEAMRSSDYSRAYDCLSPGSRRFYGELLAFAESNRPTRELSPMLGKQVATLRASLPKPERKKANFTSRDAFALIAPADPFFDGRWPDVRISWQGSVGHRLVKAALTGLDTNQVVLVLVKRSDKWFIDLHRTYIYKELSLRPSTPGVSQAMPFLK